VPYHLVRKLVKQLLIELQGRGEDASGIAVINEGEDTPSRVFKRPLRPERLVVRPVFDDMLKLITPQTNFVLLHSRAATIGTTSDNFNNHPIVTEPIIGVHNGTLWNDHVLFHRFEADFEQEGDVDSEVIFKLYKHFVDEGLTPKQAMAQVGSMLYGAFTGALIDMREPHRMVLFKHDRPLCLISLPHYDIIIAISEAQYYDTAVRLLKINAKEDCEYLMDGTGVLIDLNVRGRITQDIVDFDIPTKPKFQRNHSAWCTVIG
jgi:glucosamine 6-phosphate synthetase-like amidotransferase/phosphosugar isomerase protein